MLLTDVPAAPHLAPPARLPAHAGGASLHSCMTPHGPDTQTYAAGTAPEAEQVGHLPNDQLAFMFETYYTPRISAQAMGAPNIGAVCGVRCGVGLRQVGRPG